MASCHDIFLQVLVKMEKDPRRYSIMSKEFVDDGAGNVCGVNTVKVEWRKDETGRWNMSIIPGKSMNI